MCLQFIFGLLIMRWEYGKLFFDCVGLKFDTFLGYTDSGSSFVFGYLVDQKPFLPDKLSNNTLAKQIAEDINSAQAVSTIVVFKTLSTVYFFRQKLNKIFDLAFLKVYTTNRPVRVQYINLSHPSIVSFLSIIIYCRNLPNFRAKQRILFKNFTLYLDLIKRTCLIDLFEINI